MSDRSVYKLSYDSTVNETWYYFAVQSLSIDHKPSYEMYCSKDKSSMYTNDFSSHETRPFGTHEDNDPSY